ncbi:type I phosphodiesterase/nucleotide pyrophosphatase [Pelomyxa schiedti]|nr:type I phosphodiesterase/nucleotide pyrophosphatase [Pelomyxa schiedti]
MSSLKKASRHKVLILGLDGVRPDCLQVLAELHKIPNLTELKSASAYCDSARSVFPTLSGPAWSSILTGVGVGDHLVVDNEFTGADARNGRGGLRRYPTFFKRLSEGHMRRLSSVNGSGADDLRGEAVCESHHEDDHAVLRDALRALDLDNPESPDVLFVYFGEVDEEGHRTGYGPHASKYLDTIISTDALVGQVLQAVQARTTHKDENWVTVTVTDHGGIEFSHGANTLEEATVFLWVAGDTDTVARGKILGDSDWNSNTPPNSSTTSVNNNWIDDIPVLMDVAPTVAAHLGIPVDLSWGWKGKPRGLKSCMGGIGTPQQSSVTESSF